MGIVPITNLMPLSVAQSTSELEPTPMERVETSDRLGDESYSPSGDQGEGQDGADAGEQRNRRGSTDPEDGDADLDEAAIFEAELLAVSAQGHSVGDMIDGDILPYGERGPDESDSSRPVVEEPAVDVELTADAEFTDPLGSSDEDSNASPKPESLQEEIPVKPHIINLFA